MLYRGNDEWRKFSADFIEVNKECYACGEAASVVDHLVPHKGDKELFEKTGNHIALCYGCHNTVTGKFDHNYKVGDSVEAKSQWLNDRRMRNEVLKDRKFKSVKVINYKG